MLLLCPHHIYLALRVSCLLTCPVLHSYLSLHPDSFSSSFFGTSSLWNALHTHSWATSSTRSFTCRLYVLSPPGPSPVLPFHQGVTSESLVAYIYSCTLPLLWTWHVQSEVHISSKRSFKLLSFGIKIPPVLKVFFLAVNLEVCMSLII